MSPGLAGRLVAGQASFWREMARRPAGDAHLRLPAGPFAMLAILAAVGLARDALAVLFGIVGPRGKWYSFDPDIVFSMAFWPAHLLFVGVLLIHGGLRLVGVRNVDRRQLVAAFFHLQILHLSVPFLELVGFSLGLPHRFHIGEGRVMTPYYTNGIAMSLGIIVVWLVAFYAAWTIAFARFRLPKARALPVMGIAWLSMASWTYVFFPTLNTVFDAVFALPASKPQSYWGYGVFFALTTFAGVAYCFAGRADES